MGRENVLEGLSERNVGEAFSVNVARKAVCVGVLEQIKLDSPLSPGKPVGAVLSTTFVLEESLQSLQHVTTFSGSYRVVATKERLSVENATR